MGWETACVLDVSVKIYLINNGGKNINLLRNKIALEPHKPKCLGRNIPQKAGGVNINKHINTILIDPEFIWS